jgi:hypothetical protein
MALLTFFETYALGGSILGCCIYAAVESKNQRNNTYLSFFESMGGTLGMIDEGWKETMYKSPLERCLRIMGLTLFGGILGFISGAICGFIWPILCFIWPILCFILCYLTIPFIISIIGFGASYINIEIAKK